MFDERAYKDLINLKFFYSQENNLVMKAVVQEQMDTMLEAKAQTDMLVASWLAP